MSGSEAGFPEFAEADSAAGMGSYLLRPSPKGATACIKEESVRVQYLLRQRGSFA